MLRLLVSAAGCSQPRRYVVRRAGDWRRLYAWLRLRRPSSGWIKVEDTGQVTVWSAAVNVPLALRALPGAVEALPWLARYPRSVASLFDLWPDRLSREDGVAVVSIHSRKWKALDPSQLPVDGWPTLWHAYAAAVHGEDAVEPLRNQKARSVLNRVLLRHGDPHRVSVMRKLLRRAVKENEKAQAVLKRGRRLEWYYVLELGGSYDRWWGTDPWGRGRNVYGQLLQELARKSGGTYHGRRTGYQRRNVRAPGATGVAGK